MDGNIWLNGIMGVVVGDALGCPVQFLSRDEIIERGPVAGMEGYGTYNMPEGTWTDDSSLTLALLASLKEKQNVDLADIMDRFVDWLEHDEYTPAGMSFDIGTGTMLSIQRYEKDGDVYTCGGRSERDNGNGSLMRIMPACLYAYENGMTDDEVVNMLNEVSGLTHNHLRAKIACGLYYFCVKEIIAGTGTLKERLQKGLDKGFSYYKEDITNMTQLAYYGRLRDLDAFAAVSIDSIKSTGYVVDTIEAAVWSLIGTKSFKECLLTAVNLGDDTDTVGAVAGGLAGLYYGYDVIPKEWLDAIKRREWIEGLCKTQETY